MHQRTTSLLSNHQTRLPPEIEEGNIEYKLKLVNPTPERIEHLTTQLKWRLAEGNGEAIYEIGVSDKGVLVGLNEEEMKQSLDTLLSMGRAISAQFSILRKRKINDRSVVEVLFRKSQDDQHFLEVRVAMLGGADAGKSTFLSVLCYGDKDDGNGTARLNLLRHRHEIETGRSSSISRQIIGFTSSGDVINYATTNVSTWEQICENATRIVTFMDTCGHPKVF
jgi:GTPase